jgi:hypothetical protein
MFSMALKVFKQKAFRNPLQRSQGGTSDPKIATDQGQALENLS